MGKYIYISIYVYIHTYTPWQPRDSTCNSDLRIGRVELVDPAHGSLDPAGGTTILKQYTEKNIEIRRKAL